MNKLQRFVCRLFRIEVSRPFTIQLVENENTQDSRCTGKTTRLADAYIQLLFQTGSVAVKDHLDNDRIHHHYLLDIILQRLRREHGNVEFRTRENLIYLVNYKGTVDYRKANPQYYFI